MIGEYRFFQEFFDGQIVKEESEKYKLFKLLLISCFSVINTFFLLAGYCSVLVFAIVELGMVWNFYVGLSRKISYVFCIVVTFLYFYICSQFAVYANALVYIACYIPLQLIATGKDYSEGDFVQIKKKITDLNKILFVMFAVLLFVVLYLLDYDFGGRFIILDVLSAALLVCSAVLRNERYLEYYIFRVFALVASIVLWIFISIEFGNLDSVLVVLMYVAYLIYDVTEFCVQVKTYETEYTIKVAEYEKNENARLAESKLKEYKKIKGENEILTPTKDEEVSKTPVEKTKSSAKKQTTKTAKKSGQKNTK